MSLAGSPASSRTCSAQGGQIVWVILLSWDRWGWLITRPHQAHCLFMMFPFFGPAFSAGAKLAFHQVLNAGLQKGTKKMERKLQ